ncbi:MAG: (2Fe-2S)-binding protein [Pseudomonadota bacterium]
MSSDELRHRVSVNINGVVYRGDATARTLLTDFLRDELGFTSMRVGCEHGVCGACTIELDGDLARACLKFAVQVDGRQLRTVDGLAEDDGSLSVLQRAMKEHFALQCGYCMPGILMTLNHHLADGGAADEDTLRDVLSGNLCRCTGYSAMVEAAMDAARTLHDRESSHDV